MSIHIQVCFFSYGGQGKGKTISTVKTVIDRLEKYPECTLITNIEIKNIKNKTVYFSSADELVEKMKENISSDLEECKKGYIILIDEIHVVLSDLFGKQDPVFLQYLSQQRKCHVNILGTCQLYNKNPKMVRDYLLQNGQIVLCNKILGAIQINNFVDMENVKENSNLNLDYRIKSTNWFIHTKEMYERYDTFAVISQIKSLIRKGE